MLKVNKGPPLLKMPESTSDLDCKTVGFFLKISKEIVMRESLPSLALCFQSRTGPFVWLLARTWIRKNTDCFAVYLWLCTSHEFECLTSFLSSNRVAVVSIVRSLYTGTWTFKWNSSHPVIRWPDKYYFLRQARVKNVSKTCISHMKLP